MYIPAPPFFARPCYPVIGKSAVSRRPESRLGLAKVNFCKTNFRAVPTGGAGDPESLKVIFAKRTMPNAHSPPLETLHLLETPDVSLVMRELRPEKALHQIAGQLDPDDP